MPNCQEQYFIQIFIHKFNFHFKHLSYCYIFIVENEKRRINRERKRKIRSNETITQTIQRRLLDKERARKRRNLESSEVKNKRRNIEKLRIQKRRNLSNEDLVSRKRRRKEEIKRVDTEWPQVTPHEIKTRLMKNFINKMSAGSLSQKICAVCNGIEYESKLQRTTIQNIPNFELLTLQNFNKENHSEQQIIHSTLNQRMYYNVIIIYQYLLQPYFRKRECFILH